MQTTDREHARELTAPDLDRDRADGHEEEVSLVSLLMVIGQNKIFIFKFAVAVAAVAAIISFLLPSKYTATTTILPSQQNSSAANMLMSQLGGLGPLASLTGGGGMGIKNPNDMYVSMLRSRTVEDAMVRRFDLQKLYKDKRFSDARKDLEDHCKIENGVKDGLIRISIDDKDPKRAADMANAYVEEYRKLTANLAITEASQRRLFFERQLVEAKDHLANAEEELKKTEVKTGVIQLDSQARALIESFSYLRAQITAKEVQIQSMSSYSAPGNPELQLAQQQLAALQSQLKRLGESESEVGNLIVPTGKVPQAGLDYIRKFRDVKYYETIFELLARQLEVARLDEAKEGALLQVIDVAVQPDRRSFPKRGLITLVAFFAGLVLAYGWVLFQRSRARANRDPRRSQELEQLRDAWAIRPNDQPFSE